MANFTPAYLTGFLVIILNACCALALSCYNSYSYLNYEYCYGSENHCCGSYGDQYCCYRYSLEGGTIAGIVIGCLIGITILVTLVIICCVAMNKNRGTVGRVVHPAGGAGLTVVNTSSQQQVSRTWTLSCYNKYKYFNLEICYGSQNDCCGYYSYKYCCYTSITTGAIVGIVIGSLIGFAILVGLVICCCCAINKSTGAKGRVVNPVGGGVTVVNTAAHQQAWGGPVPTHGYQPYGGGMYGQPYPGPAPAPVYMQPAPGAVPGPSSDPVYPPPPAYQPPMDGQKT